MAVKLLQVLVLGVIAAARAAPDDVPVTWLPARASLPCVVPGAGRLPLRRPPPPLEPEDRRRERPYVWLRGDEELKRVSNNGTLELSKRKDGAGLYQCYARHLAGRVLGYPVNVKFAYLEKQFSVHPLNATAWRGQPYVLSCAISSGPPAVITWLRNSRPLPDDDRFFLLNSQLLITEVRYEDAGLYRCRATNPQANKTRTSHGGRLVVEDSPGDVEVAFLPMAHESHIAVPRGSRLVLPCPLLGDDRPKLIWELTPPGARTSELEAVEEVLVLPRAELDQEGVYTCRAEGSPGIAKSFNVTITETVNITHGPESRQAVRASTARFNCTATGRPAPRVSWYKDGQELQLTQRISVVLSAEDKRTPQLLIRGVTSEDSGIYQCFARNSVSAASAWAALAVTGDEAAAPGALRCRPAAAAEVRLAWTRVPHDIIAYTVQTTLPGGDSFPEQPVQSTNTTIKVKSPLTPYGFQVRAFIKSPAGKKNGASDMSETVTCQGQGVPIKLAKIEEGSILVSWQQFHRENPGVVQWILQYRIENGTDEKNITLDGHIYNYTLKVVPSEAVQVRVLGSRSLPWWPQDLSLVPWSSTSSAPRQLAPGETLATPVELEATDVNPRNFTVKWQCEQDSKYAFLVCVRKLEGNEPAECWDSYMTSAKIVRVQPGTEYEVRVQAALLTKEARGEFSAPLRVATPPEDELQYAHEHGGVRVRWRGAGTRDVRYSQNLSQPLEAWRLIPNVTGQVKITGLDPQQPTYVMVAAPGPSSRRPVLTIKPLPPNSNNVYFIVSVCFGVVAACLLVAVAVGVWRGRRKAASPARARSPHDEGEGSELKNVGGRLANGGGSRDAGEPLLNGHVHITENPTQSKTPNGKVRRAAAAFDVARYDDADITVETVLDDTAHSLLDASRRPGFDSRPELTPNSSFKLPDDNMNSELTRSFRLDDGKILPTLQPNG